MPPSRRRVHPALAVWVGCLAGVGLGSGCGEELGPEQFATSTVRGRVVVGGQPVGGGFIEIHPTHGTPGNFQVGPILPDGSFQIDRAPVGDVILSLTLLPVGSIPSVGGPADPRLFDIRSRLYQPLERTIPPGDRADLPLIDLMTEVARQRRRPAPRRRKRAKRRGLGLVRPPGKPLGRRTPGPVPAPGAQTVARSPGTLTIQVSYRDSGGTIHRNHPPDQIRATLDDASGTVWIDIEDLDSAHNGEVEALLGDLFHFHPLAIEDALKDVHVPRIDDWGTYLYLIVNTLDFDRVTDELRVHELDLFLGSNFLVTYHHEPIDVLDRHHRLIERETSARLQDGPSHLLHQILDDVVDQFLPAIEHLDAAIDDAQDEVFDRATSDTLRRIFHIKGCALRLHRVVTPMREVLNRLARDPYPQIRAEHRVYFRDVYDHLVRVHDIVESLRDLIAGALDTYLSIVSNRTNDIMKVLTLLNVMFLPMTFIAGFFGMNFFGETLMFQSPVLPKTLLFWATVGLMVATPVGMWLAARRRGWFSS